MRSGDDAAAIPAAPDTFSGWIVVALVAGVFAIGSEALVISPLLKDLAEATGTDLARAGLIVSAYGITLALVAPLSGLLSDLVSRRLAIIGGLLLFAVAGLACAASQGFLSLVGGRVLCGLAAGTFLPACYAYVGDEVPYEARARTMGRVMSGWALAVVLGVPMGGLLGHWVGWRGAFVAVSAIAFCASSILLWLPGKTRPNRGRLAWKPALRALADAVRTPAVPMLLAVDFLEMFGFYGTYTYLGTYLRDTLLLTSGGAALLIIFEGLGTTTTTLTARLLDRVGKERALFVALLLQAATVMLLPYAIAVHLFMLVLMLFVWGALQGVCMTCLNTIGSQRSPAARGAIMALMSCMTYSAVTIGSAVLGPVYQNPALGYGAITLICGLSLALAAAMFRRSRRALQTAGRAGPATA